MQLGAARSNQKILLKLTIVFGESFRARRRRTKLGKCWKPSITTTASFSNESSSREDFEKFDLVYVLPQRVWVPPSSCLWTQATHIAGKYAIAAQYSQLKDFFVGKLRVETPNLQIYIQELKSVVHSDTPPDIAMLKAIIMETCTQLPAKGTLNDIRKIPLLPVQDFGGDIILESAEHPFAIVDRLDYGEVFQHKLCFLDFTLEEVWRLQPFLAALGLQDRYVSSLVKEISTAEDGIGSATLTGNFRKQAYGIFR